jgi:phage tail sheath gpL-like
MALGQTVVTINHPNEDLAVDYTLRNNTYRVLINFLAGLANSAKGLGASVDVKQNGGTGVQASGTVTLSSASGTVGATINGVSTTVTASGGDTATATALAAAINASANALIAGLYTAAAAAGVVTITAVSKGALGNATTLAASGTGATASGTRLTGGVDAAAQVVTF